MSLTLLALAAATPDLAFDAYGKCAQGAAAAYKGSTATIETVVGRVQTDCARERTTLIEVAPDKRQAAEWVRMTTTLAVAEHAPGLTSAGSDARSEKASAKPALSRYPKLDAYRVCVDDQAARIEAEMPYAAIQAVATEAVTACEKSLKTAADETVAEMRQPGLRQQVTNDFRRRSTSELIQKIGAKRAGKAP